MQPPGDEHSTASQKHLREVVASSQSCLVERCDCGTLQISVGPLTFRTRPEMVDELWATLGTALSRLAARDAAASAPSASFMLGAFGRPGGAA